jgi:hypothetical protein
VALFVLLTLPLVACRADASYNLGTAASDVTGRAAIAADPRYKVFASDDEAFAWATGFEAGLATARGTAPRAFVARTDPRYAQARAVVGALWQGFDKLYPQVVAGLPAPVTILVEDSNVNAYAVFDPTLGQIPLAFFIQTAALGGSATPLTPAELHGLIGHELTHLVMAHVYPGVANARAIHYRVAGDETLGFLQEDDPQVKAAIEAWTDEADVVGDFPEAALHGVPFIPSLLGQVLTSALHGQLAQTPVAAACTEAGAALGAILDLRNRTFDFANLTWPLDDATRAKLDGASAHFVDAATECFSAGPTMVEAMARALGIDPATAQMILARDPDAAAVASATNVAVAITTITKNKYAHLAALRVETDYSALRVRTDEEEADDNAMWVTHLIGQDSRGIGDFLLSHAIETPAARTACQAMLQKGTVPGYGFLSDPHHGTCYRVFHVDLFHRLIFGAAQ